MRIRPRVLAVVFAISFAMWTVLVVGFILAVAWFIGCI